jgi:hypothetical protein
VAKKAYVKIIIILKGPRMVGEFEEVLPRERHFHER